MGENHFSNRIKIASLQMPEAKRKEMNSPSSVVSEGENLTSCHCLMCQYRIVISRTVCGSRGGVCLLRSPALRSLGSFWTLSLQAVLNLESAQVTTHRGVCRRKGDPSLVHRVKAVTLCVSNWPLSTVYCLLILLKVFQHPGFLYICFS